MTSFNSGKAIRINVYDFVFSGVLLLHGIISLVIGLSFQYQYPSFAETYLFACVFVFCWICFYYRFNFLFLIRMVFLGMMGIVPMLAMAMGGMFAFRASFSQTLDIAFIMLILSSLALVSSHIGFTMSKYVYVKKGCARHDTDWFVYLCVFIATVVCAHFIGVLRGEFVFNAGYGSVEKGKVELPINNLNVFARIGIYLLFFMYVTAKRSGDTNKNLYFWLFLIASFYLIVVNEFLRGARMDPLTEIVALMVLVRCYSTEKFDFSLRYILYFVILFVLIQVWGYLRVALVYGVDYDSVVSAFTLEPRAAKSGATVLFFQGTLNNLYVTISTTIYGIKHNLIEYWYGKSYLDFLLRTPPAFIYPDRPESLSWLPIRIFGDGTSAGGYTELAEVYLNFGLLGALVIPGIISFLIGYSLKMFLMNKYSLICAIPIFSILSVYFRGNLYQTFTFYRGFVTGVIILILVWLAQYYAKNFIYPDRRCSGLK